jgi:hypothetical protein
MHYIAEEAITGAVLPLLQTKEETYMVGFSTPSGMRTPFYSFCEEAPHCKEFHHSYRVLPHWKAVEADRNNFTHEKWTHEFEADWGSSEDGVYNPKYVDAAGKNYLYKDQKPISGWKYCIGVDWNEKYGTEISVVGLSGFNSRFKLVESLHIEPSEFTQLSGVKKILEMNKKWKPEYIYIDAGNGSTNYELLRKRAQKSIGVDSLTARLLKTLKKYDSGASIETKDPVTKKKVKKPAKSFMINASVRFFEQYMIDIPTEDVKLDKQIRNYIIVRYTPNGNPVYGLNEEKIGDHRLDAFNLALVAFHLEFDSLHIHNNVSTAVGAAPDPRKAKKDNDRLNLDEDNTPDARRLDHGLGFSMGHVSGKVKSNLNKNRNRLGWETDEEEKFVAIAAQRKRSRNRHSGNRPQRTNF